MTISTVNALAASARAYLTRTVAPASRRSVDDAAAAQRRSDDAALRRERESTSGAKAANEATRESNAARRSAEHGSVDAKANPSASKESPTTPASSSQVKAGSSDDAADAPERDADSLDTGTLVARFFDVLQAAAQAGGAAPRVGSPALAGESADGSADDADATRGSASASNQADGLGITAVDAFYGPAMSMPWVRTAGGHAAAAVDDRAARLSVGSVGSADSQAITGSSGPVDPKSTSNGGSGHGSPVAAAELSTLAAASIAAESAPAVTGSWPLFGPSASRPSARAGTEPSPRANAQADNDALDSSASPVAAGPSRADTDRLSSFDTGGAMLDRLRAAASTTAAGSAAAASNGAASALWPWPSTAAGPTGSSTAVPLAANAPSEWRDTLSQALGDRLQLTLKQGADQAVIRLDPPMLGRIDLSIRQDGATLSVHLSASNPEVLRQLQAMGDGLRQDLATRHAGDLTVTVASQPSGLNAEADARQRQPRQGDDAGEATPGRALAEAETPSSDEEAGTRSYASLTRSGGAA